MYVGSIGMYVYRFVMRHLIRTLIMNVYSFVLGLKFSSVHYCVGMWTIDLVCMGRGEDGVRATIILISSLKSCSQVT